MRQRGQPDMSHPSPSARPGNPRNPRAFFDVDIGGERGGGRGFGPRGGVGRGAAEGKGARRERWGGTAATWPPRAPRAASRPALPGRGAAALSGTPGGGTRPRGAPRPGRAAPGGAAGGCGPARPRGRHLLPAGLAAPRVAVSVAVLEGVGAGTGLG